MISTEFEFDITQLKGKEGFIKEAAKNPEAKKWAQDNVGQDCEYREDLAKNVQVSPPKPCLERQ